MWRIAWILALWGLVGSPLPAPAQGAKDTLSVDLPGEPASLDPHVQWDTDSYHVYRNIFDNLVTRNPDGKIVPQIAKAWRYENDTTLVLDIRTDVKFHDGTPLTVDDVAWSVQRIIDPAFKSPQLSQFNSIVKAEAVGTDKVRLTTSSPYPALLAQLVKLSIVPRAYVQKVGNEKFNVEPMGSGPYRFVSWQKGVRVTLAANESYWRGRPPFKTVTFQMVPDTATRIANLKTGRADIIRQLNPDDAASLKGESRLQILSVPTERIGYLFINALAGPTKDVRVRRAIAHAINRQLLIDALLGGYGRPVTILLTPANFGYIEGMKGYPFDPTRARPAPQGGRGGGRRDLLLHLARLRPAAGPGDPADAAGGRAQGRHLPDGPADLPEAPPGKARGGRQHLARAMVVRLPGRGRRDLPPVPQPEPLGEVREPRLRRRGHAGPADARRTTSGSSTTARPSPSSSRTCRASGSTRTSRSTPPGASSPGSRRRTRPSS